PRLLDLLLALGAKLIDELDPIPQDQAVRRDERPRGADAHEDEREDYPPREKSPEEADLGLLGAGLGRGHTAKDRGSRAPGKGRRIGARGRGLLTPPSPHRTSPLRALEFL